ncbi:MAG: VCBS repeat-containing protein, partial [Candidatus Eisenbacteria bacterium]|nr:VCBS repeat-containing protein [Candidatus Eisenbacteria bacterium]
MEPTDRFIGDGRILHGIGTWFGFQFPSPLTRFDDPAFFVKIYETGADGCPSSDPVYEAYCTNVEVNHKVHVPGIQSAEYLIDFEANGYAPFLKKLGVDYAISIVYDHADFCSPSTPVIAFILFAGEGGDGIYGCGRDTSSPLGWVPGAFDLAMYHCDSEGPPPPSFCVGDELGQAIPPERIGVGFLATECVEAVEPYPVEPTQLFVGDGQVLTGVGFWMHYNYAPAPPSSGFRFRVYETGPDGCPFGSALLDLTAYKISQGPEAGTPVDPIEYYCDFTLNSGGHDLRTVAGVQYALSIQSLDCPGAGATAYWAPGIGGDGSAGCVLAPDLYGPDWVPLSDVGFSGDFAMYLCTEPPADTAPFSDVSNAATADPGDGFGVAWGDYDGDDDPDLYVSNRGVANKLLRNDAGVFVDATSGALGDPGNSYSGLWGDYDGDGDVDLYIANRDTPSRLLRNDAGTFVDVTPPPLGDAALILGATWVDFDNDGDLDLYVNKLTEANRLYRNDGGSWID